MDPEFVINTLQRKSWTGSHNIPLPAHVTKLSRMTAHIVERKCKLKLEWTFKSSNRRIVFWLCNSVLQDVIAHPKFTGTEHDLNHLIMTLKNGFRDWYITLTSDFFFVQAEKDARRRNPLRPRILAFDLCNEIAIHTRSVISEETNQLDIYFRPSTKKDRNYQLYPQWIHPTVIHLRRSERIAKRQHKK